MWCIALVSPTFFGEFSGKNQEKPFQQVDFSFGFSFF
jgi:hypothetical protein